MSHSVNKADKYPLDFTVQAPGQKCGWLCKSRKSRIGLKVKYNTVWVELDEVNQSLSCFTNESYLGALKSELLVTLALDKARISSSISKNGKRRIVIIDKHRKKHTFATKTEDENKSWMESFARARSSTLTNSSVLNKWVSDCDTLQKLELAGDMFRSLDDKEPSLESNDNNTTAEESEVEEDDLFVNFDKDLKRTLYSMFLQDQDGNLVLFGDVVHGQTTLLFFLRHFGCILWRAAVEEVIEKRAVLEKCGIRVAAIGNGTPEMARRFLEDYPKFPGHLFVDVDKKIYKAMHCKFGLKYALSKEVLRGAREACEKGFKQKGIQGDPLQLGGTFILSPTKGMIYRRLENYIGSPTDLPNLLPFINDYALNSPESTWSCHSADTEPAKNGREYRFSYYESNFALQLHYVYVFPKREDTGSSVIVAITELKQGDKTCLAFHSKGKTKLYWPCYLKEQEMFGHLSRISNRDSIVDGYIKITRCTAVTDRLCQLEAHTNSYFSSVDTKIHLESVLEDCAQYLIQSLISPVPTRSKTHAEAK